MVICMVSILYHQTIKKSKWRVPAICLDENGVERKPSQDIEEIKLLKETKALKFWKD